MLMKRNYLRLFESRKGLQASRKQTPGKEEIKLNKIRQIKNNPAS